MLGVAHTFETGNNDKEWACIFCGTPNWFAPRDFKRHNCQGCTKKRPTHEQFLALPSYTYKPYLPRDPYDTIDLAIEKMKIQGAKSDAYVNALLKEDNEEKLRMKANEYWTEFDGESWETCSESDSNQDSDWDSVVSHDWEYTPTAIPPFPPPELHESPTPLSPKTSLPIYITPCPVLIPPPTPDTTRTTVKVNFFLRTPHAPTHSQQCKGPRLRKVSTIPPPQFTLTPSTTHAQSRSNVPRNPLLTFITIHIRTTLALHNTFLSASHATHIHNIHTTLKQLYPSNLKFIPRRHCFFLSPSYSPRVSTSYSEALYNTIVQFFCLFAIFVQYFCFFPPDIRPIGVLCAGIG
jgi:hypothetical protein